MDLLTHRCRIVIFGLLALICHNAMAADPFVPVNMQLPLFRNIWKLDRNLDSRAKIVVAVVYQESHAPSEQVKTQVMNWGDAKGRHLNTIAVAIDGPEGLNVLRTVVADVFYIAPLRAADIEAIAKIARARHIRTNTGVTKYVEDGLGVAIDIRDDHPLIVINLHASQAEGASFPAQLLELARLTGVTP